MPSSAMTRGGGRLEAEQVGGGAGRARAHALVEIAADQQEEQQRDGGVEVDVPGAAHGLEEAHGGREDDAERDRDVHVEAAALQRLARRAEERLAGVGYGRQCDQGGQPVEQRADALAHVAAEARPDRHRQQHDVGGGEAGDSDAFQEIAVACVGFGLSPLDQLGGGKSGLFERLDHAVDPDPARIVGDADALGGEVDARRRDARKRAERVLARHHAGAAIHRVGDQRCCSGHRRVVVQRFARVVGIGGGAGVGGGRGAGQGFCHSRFLIRQTISSPLVLSSLACTSMTQVPL